MTDKECMALTAVKERLSDWKVDPAQYGDHRTSAARIAGLRAAMAEELFRLIENNSGEVQDSEPDVFLGVKAVVTGVRLRSQETGDEVEIAVLPDDYITIDGDSVVMVDDHKLIDAICKALQQLKSEHPA